MISNGPPKFFFVRHCLFVLILLRLLHVHFFLVCVCVCCLRGHAAGDWTHTHIHTHTRCACLACSVLLKTLFHPLFFSFCSYYKLPWHQGSRISLTRSSLSLSLFSPALVLGYLIFLSGIIYWWSESSGYYLTAQTRSGSSGSLAPHFSRSPWPSKAGIEREKYNSEKEKKKSYTL